MMKKSLVLFVIGVLAANVAFAVSADTTRVKNSGAAVSSTTHKVYEDVTVSLEPGSKYIDLKSESFDQLRYELIDRAGNVLLTGKGKSRIDIRGVAEGIYFLKVKIGNRRTVLKRVDIDL